MGFFSGGLFFLLNKFDFHTGSIFGDILSRGSDRKLFSSSVLYFKLEEE